MRNWSWMTARALLAGLALVSCGRLSASADEEPSTPAAVENTVRLEIEIFGLGSQGGKVSIKPAHPGCRFKAVEQTVNQGTRGEVVRIEPFAIAASSTSADRDCSFEITITEPGRKPTTFRRGLQLATPSAGASAAPSRTLKCRLPATAVAVRDDAKTARPRR